jgi:hypothetical protein|mmetsp:Transcript_24581/g.42144  ORF Transcript_24581/g.42144 Transcript_24581/m.42144 type:complete len:226 (-) Transcript_24581:39-716(-)
MTAGPILPNPDNSLNWANPSKINLSRHISLPLFAQIFPNLMTRQQSTGCTSPMRSTVCGNSKLLSSSWGMALLSPLIRIRVLFVVSLGRMKLGPKTPPGCTFYGLSRTNLSQFAVVGVPLVSKCPIGCKLHFQPPNQLLPAYLTTIDAVPTAPPTLNSHLNLVHQETTVHDPIIPPQFMQFICAPCSTFAAWNLRMRPVHSHSRIHTIFPLRQTCCLLTCSSVDT